MSAEQAQAQTLETLDDILGSLEDLGPVTEEIWQKEKTFYINRDGEESIFALTPESGKRGLTGIINKLARVGLGTQHAIASSSETELMTVMGKGATPLTKKIALALRNEAIIRITQG